MMTHIEHFRTVRSARPALADQLMALWGCGEFSRVVGDSVRSLMHGAASTSPLLLALQKLLVAHNDEFPAFATESAAPNREALDNANFQLISQRFPHIGEKLLLSWGTSEFPKFVNALINDTRDGERKGFPPEIMLALWHIQEEHDVLYPASRVRIVDIWSLNDSE